MKTKYTVKITSQFKKQYKLMVKQGINLSELDTVIIMLAKGEELPVKYKDHQLTGTLKDIRECHIKDDWLLEYQIFEQILVLSLVAIGSHSELFKK